MIGLFFGLAASTLAGAIERAKATVTYPRTGYVAPPGYSRENAREEIAGLDKGLIARVTRWLGKYGSFVLCFVALLLPRNVQMKPWMLISAGAVVGLFFASRLMENRFYAVDVLSYPALGLTAALLLNRHTAAASGLAALAPALVLILRGTLTFIRYLHQHALPQQ